MSVFEQKAMSKINIDDTDVLTANIINSELVEGHIEYVIIVEKEFSSEPKWYVRRRYKDFLTLHQTLQTSEMLLTFPPKKYIGNLERKFILERQIALQVYLDEVLMNPILSVTFELKNFLDPINYKNVCRESALSDLRIAFRSDKEVKFIKQLPQLGWRFRKQSFIVSLKDIPKKENLLHWIPFGPDKYLEDRELDRILKSITSLQHVNIVKIEMAGLCRGGGWILHDIKNGTLLDMLYDVKEPINISALKKYACTSKKKTLDVSEVVEISAQILQAIAFLHHKNIPYGHLHPGNIVFDGNSVKLFGIENALFGLPCYYRQYVIKCRCIDSLQCVDVYCFGLTMYSMLFLEPFSKDIPENCPLILKNVLEMILTPKAQKNGLPTVKALLNLQVFRRPPPNPLPYFKLSVLISGSLAIIANNTFFRLKLDIIKAREQKKAKTVLRLLMENDSTLPSCSLKQFWSDGGWSALPANLNITQPSTHLYKL